jgi:hypothetical protein
MEHDNLVHGLVRRRAEIAGLVEACQQQLHDLVTDLGHVDAVIRMFRPEVDLSEVKVRPRPQGALGPLYGVMTKTVLDSLRESGSPLTVRDLALAVLTAHALPADDPEVVRSFYKRVSASLAALKRRGQVVSAQGPGARLVWALAGDQAGS